MIPGGQGSLAGAGIPGGVLSSSSVAEGEPLYDAGRWTVTVYEESPFEKVGRLYLDGGCLVSGPAWTREGFLSCSPTWPPCFRANRRRSGCV